MPADSLWRNRTDFFQGRDAIEAFLTKKWQKELQYKLMKELWCYQGNRISVRFEYEYHDHEGQWWRAHGNEVSMILLYDTCHAIIHAAVHCVQQRFCSLSESQQQCCLQHWEFNKQGYMTRRDMSANDYKIEETQRRYR